MHRQTPRDTSLRAYSSGGARGVVHKADDTKLMQELKINFLHKETRDKAEHPQNYGFTSYCREADYDGVDTNGGGEENVAGEKQKIIKKAAEHFTQFMGGARSFPVIQNLDDRRFRCRNMDEGEVCVYDDQQQKLHIMRKRIYGRSQFKIEFRVIEDEKEEDGHGRDAKASRDMKKDESKRRSTIVMDEDTIILEKTKVEEQGKQKQQREPGEDDDYQTDWEDPEKEYRKDPKVKMYSQVKMTDEEIVLTTYRDGDPHLQFKLSEIDNLITMQTIRNGRPNLAWTVDEENNEVTFQASPDLIFEMDDEEKRITLRTEKGERPFQVLEMDLKNETMTLKTNSKTEMVFNHKASEITIHADSMVRVGDRAASDPVGIKGTVDTNGDKLIAKFAKKILVK